MRYSYPWHVRCSDGFRGVLVAADEVCPGREKNLEVGGLGSHDTAQYTGAGHERIRGNHNEASQPTHKS